MSIDPRYGGGQTASLSISPEDFPDYPPFVLQGSDSGQEQLRLFSGRQISNIGALTEIGFRLNYIADWGPRCVPGVINLSGNPKYAMIQARKRLEDRGELTPDGFLRIYRRHKSTNTETSMLYGVIPRHRHQIMEKMADQYSSGLLVFDPVSILLSLLQGMEKGKTHALAMKLPGSIVFLAGKDMIVYQAGRYILPADDPQSFGDAIRGLEHDLVLLKKETGEEIETIHLIDAFNESGDSWQSHNSRLSFTHWPMHEMEYRGSQVRSALPGIWPDVRAKYALMPAKEPFFRLLEDREAGFRLILFILGIFFALGAVVISLANGGLEKDIAALSESVEAYRNGQETEAGGFASAYGISERETSELNATSVLLGKCANALESVTPAEICALVFRAAPASMRYDSIESRYAEKTSVRLRGRIGNDPVAAISDLTTISEKMAASGFNETKRELTPSFPESSFFIEFEKKRGI